MSTIARIVKFFYKWLFFLIILALALISISIKKDKWNEERSKKDERNEHLVDIYNSFINLNNQENILKLSEEELEELRKKVLDLIN